MRDLLLLAIHLLVTLASVLRPGGVRTVAAESLLLEHSSIRVDFIFSSSPYEAEALSRVNRVKIGASEVR